MIHIYQDRVMKTPLTDIGNEFVSKCERRVDYRFLENVDFTMSVIERINLVYLSCGLVWYIITLSKCFK